MKKSIKALVAGVGIGLLAVASNASAALDLTGVTMNTADVETMMGYIIPGLAALWGYRKIVKSVNRS